MSGDLLERINAAVKAANEAEHHAETAKTEYVSRSRTWGALLLEAKKIHPRPKDWDRFLSQVVGLKKSRVADLLKIAGGPSVAAQLEEEERQKKANRDRVKRHRAEKKSLPKPETAPDSITSAPVMETAQQTASIDTGASADTMRAKFAALDDDLGIPSHLDRRAPEIVQDAATRSGNAWIEIKTIIDMQLPDLLAADKLNLFTYIINHPALAGVKVPKRQKAA
jgi:hypothetical protein